MSLLTHRHGDNARLRADRKKQARVFVLEQSLDREFTASELARATGMAFTTAANHLRTLESKGLVVGSTKPRDLRRYYRRARGEA